MATESAAGKLRTVTPLSGTHEDGSMNAIGIGIFLILLVVLLPLLPMLALLWLIGWLQKR